MKTFSLYELNEFLRRVVALNFNEAVWVTAEIGQINQSRGHYYIRLLEKEEDDIIAEMSAVIWQTDFRRLQRSLGKATEGVFVEGMEVRLKGRLDFHERYGLKLIVEEIDPTYTVGKLEIQKRHLIMTLQSEGLIERNAALPTPSVWQRIAVISSETAAGWADFRNHISSNAYGFCYHVQLFPSAMQGQFLEKEMLQQLENIKQQKDRFDCVVIIRGGGAKLDLVAFDTPSVCRAVATFPLPVLTGIGHEIDITVLDMVAFASLKTPTAVADFLIEKNLIYESSLIEIGRTLTQFVQNRLYTEGAVLSQLNQIVQLQTTYLFKTQVQKLTYFDDELPKLAQKLIKRQSKDLDNLSELIDLMSVESILKRGFSVTRKNGQIVQNINELKPDDVVETQLIDGIVSSQIISKSYKL
ncbi:MAG: exodeoxyribonuclease VII large subunit [Saprospiraceae bacterium]|nr:exodeoxyribonuclease VII large subunit [Saprospiraceae bacterium]